MCQTDALTEALRLVLLLEARTYRNQAKQVITQALQDATTAADALAASRFSQSARLTFRSRISGMLRRSAPTMAQLGWYAGGGTGKPPPEIARTFIDEQQQFLSRWFLQIKAAGALVGGAVRARMYAQALEQVYQRAYMAAAGQKIGLPPLPAYPRDGSTRCRTNCNCYWEGPLEREDENGRYYALYWRLRPGESCDDCIRRATVQWNPLKVVNVNGIWTFEEGQA